jgi:hypothetical protein
VDFVTGALFGAGATGQSTVCPSSRAWSIWYAPVLCLIPRTKCACVMTRDRCVVVRLMVFPSGSNLQDEVWLCHDHLPASTPGGCLPLSCPLRFGHTGFLSSSLLKCCSKLSHEVWPAVATCGVQDGDHLFTTILVPAPSFERQAGGACCLKRNCAVYGTDSCSAQSRFTKFGTWVFIVISRAAALCSRLNDLLQHLT